ncbi:MAG TPA: ADP-ribosylation factor-like protein [Aggregatilineales bacterium]|nr:ADP-ribosylation factor-like protein [Aggregatilineales bacterium]
MSAIRYLKFAVAGGHGAGKTTFIQAASDSLVVTSAGAYGRTDSSGDMDYATVTINSALVLSLFGTEKPCPEDFLWQILIEGMHGLIVLVDSTQPARFADARAALQILTFAPVPYLVAANKQDIPGAQSPETIRTALALDTTVKILPCVARTKDAVKAVVLELATPILETLK